MKFGCPNCGRAVNLRQTRCEACQQALGVISLVKFYRAKLRQGIFHSATIRCPNCPATIPIQSHCCPECQHPLTVEAAVNSVVEPRKRRLFDWARSSSPETRRRIQWMYFFFSLSLLWLALVLVQNHFQGSFLVQSALAVVFLSGFGLLTATLIPKAVIRTFMQRTSALLKLALIANYLTAMLAMRILTTTWQEEAFTLAGMLITTWVAGFVLLTFVWPMAQGVAALHQDPNPNATSTFNATNPQGRKARYD